MVLKGEEDMVSWPDGQVLELISSGILGQQKLAASGNNYRRCNMFPHTVQIVGSLEKRGSAKKKSLSQIYYSEEIPERYALSLSLHIDKES